MAASTCYFFVALVCGAVCNPLGQTTICETQNRRNGLLQALGSATVVDATPNLHGRGYRHGFNLQGGPYLPSYVNGPFYPYGFSPGYGSTTVCESVPNVGPGLGVVLSGSGLSPIIPGSTTVCESTPNLGLGIGGNGCGGAGGLGAIVPGSATVSTCESIPNFGPGLCYGMPYYPNRACQTNICESITPNLGLGTGCIGYGGSCGLGAIVPGSTTICTGEGYGGPYFPNNAGQTTICETITPNLGSGIGCNGCGGTGGPGAIFPDSATVCTCESSPNFGPGLCYGGPYYPNNAGQTTICESITPNLGLGIGCNGCGGTVGLGAICPDTATVSTCESIPNSGVCYGGPYFPNKAGQINICESVPNICPGYPYGIPRCNNFYPGLVHGYQQTGCQTY